jgi:hypothetical protein
MTNRDLPFFTETLGSEKTITKQAAERAIYIDFEGFEAREPSLIGISIDSHFEQVILSIALRSAAKAKGLVTRDGKEYLNELFNLAIKEDRKIVAFSSHEKEQCQKWYGLNISEVYVNANLVAKAWYRKTYPATREKITGLKDYLKLIGVYRGDYLGVRQTTQRIKAVEDMLERKGAYELLTPVNKAKWTKLLEHNKIDVEGMKSLVLKTVDA